MSLQFVERHIKNNQSYVKNAQKADERYELFQERGPLGAVLHSIGTPQPKAEPIGLYFDAPNVESSVHMILEPAGKCLCLAPENYRLWHVGGSANNTHMGIELTEPKEIVYDPKKGYAVTVLDEEKALAHVKATYERAVELFAHLCRKYGWDPLKDGVILSHRECYRRGLGSNHGDPEHLWEALNTGYTMDSFRKAVSLALTEGTEEAGEAGEGSAPPVKSPAGENPSLSHSSEGDRNVADPDLEKEDDVEMKRFLTLGELKQDPNRRFYLPTVEKLLQKGYLKGKGGEGDELVIDLSEESIRILVTLDRAEVFGK